jgi:hypothetical protein
MRETLDRIDSRPSIHSSPSPTTTTLPNLLCKVQGLLNSDIYRPHILQTELKYVHADVTISPVKSEQRLFFLFFFSFHTPPASTLGFGIERFICESSPPPCTHPKRRSEKQKDPANSCSISGTPALGPHYVCGDGVPSSILQAMKDDVRGCYFLRNEQPSVSLALPPVGWHSTVAQPAQMTTV